MHEFRFVDEEKEEVEHIPTGARFYVYPNVHLEGTWVAGKTTRWGREYVLEEVIADVKRFLQAHGLEVS